QLLAFQLDCAFIARTGHGFSKVASGAMSNAEDIIQLPATIVRAMAIQIGISIRRKISGNLCAADIASVPIQFGSTTVCDQGSASLHESANLLHLLHTDS